MQGEADRMILKADRKPRRTKLGQDKVLRYVIATKPRP
jgi:hypothetical protein